MEIKKLYDADRIAEMFHVTKATVWRWGREGRLHPIRVGKKHLYSEDQVRALLAEYSQDPILFEEREGAADRVEAWEEEVKS